VAPGRSSAVTAIEDLLGFDGDGFAFGCDLHGAFGGVFGGVLAASVLLAARPAAPARVPSGLDCRFLRGVSAGRSTATVTPVHGGRTVSCVRVDLHDERGRLTTTGTVSFVDPGALRPLSVDPAAGPSPRWRPWRTPEGVRAPIVERLRPEVGAAGAGAIATRVDVPWTGHREEAACVAADLSVGPPVAAACEGTWSPHPNPDLSLRFTAAAADGTVTSVARLAALAGGVAAVALDVGFAVGVATSVVLPGAA
jgi:hypothetical protein